MVVRNIKQKLIQLVPFFLIVSDSVTSQSLVETIQYIQYDKEYAYCSENDADAINAPKFFGGETFFKSYFSGLLNEVKSQTSMLKELHIQPRSISPSATVLNSAYKVIRDTGRDKIKKIDILLGENDQLVFCYEDGVLVGACEERHRALFEATATSWVYSYVCDNWQAQFVDTAVKLRSDNLLTKVVIWIWIDIQNIDVNQCPDSQDPLFADTALCLKDVSECVYKNGSGFVVGSYSCHCLDCSECEALDGFALSDPDKNSTVMQTSQCAPKKPPKEIILLDSTQRYGMLAVSAACILLCFTLGLLIILFHQSQAIEDACLSVLLLILVGAICKYAAHILMLWPLSELSCFVIPWLAEGSFVCIFPVITIKLQLSSTKSRKGSRWVSNTQVLKYWTAAVLFTALYMASWTASTWSYSSAHGVGIVRPGDGVMTAPHCLITASSYVTQIGEVLVLCYGITYGVFTTHSVSSVFREGLWYTIVLALELLVSIGYYLFWPLYGLEGYSLLLATTVYYHLTVTLVVLLIFCPKLHHARVGTRAADINDDLYGSPVQGPDYGNAHAQTKLEQANQEIIMLKEKLQNHGDASGGSPKTSPGHAKSRAKGQASTANEMKPLNIGVNEKSF